MKFPPSASFLGDGALAAAYVFKGLTGDGLSSLSESLSTSSKTAILILPEGAACFLSSGGLGVRSLVLKVNFFIKEFPAPAA